MIAVNVVFGMGVTQMWDKTAGFRHYFAGTLAVAGTSALAGAFLDEPFLYSVVVVGIAIIGALGLIFVEPLRRDASHKS